MESKLKILIKYIFLLLFLITSSYTQKTPVIDHRRLFGWTGGDFTRS